MPDPPNNCARLVNLSQAGSALHSMHARLPCQPSEQNRAAISKKRSLGASP